MSTVLDNQGKLPSEIKTVRAKTNEIKPQKLKVIIQEFFPSSTRKGKNQEYRENNLILYRVQEKTMRSSDNRIFCVNGLQKPEGLKLKRAIRLGSVKNDRNLNSPRPLEIVLEDQQEKIKAFRKLRNLP